MLTKWDSSIQKWQQRYPEEMKFPILMENRVELGLMGYACVKSKINS